MELIGYLALAILFGVFLFVIINLMHKMERMEDQEADMMNYIDELETWIANFRQDVGKAYDNMKTIDGRGSFESDDEVGTTFKTLKEIMEEIDNVTNPENNDETR